MPMRTDASDHNAGQGNGEASATASMARKQQPHGDAVPMSASESHHTHEQAPPVPLPLLLSTPTPPPPPPPPLPPPPLPTQLADHFRAHRAARACQLLRECSGKEAHAEVLAAFDAVPWAPSAFLLALEQWPQDGSIERYRALVGSAVEALTRLEVPPPPSAMTMELAGAVLLSAPLVSTPLPSLVAFARAFHVPRAHVLALAQRLLMRRVSQAVKLLHALDMLTLLPFEDVVAATIRQRDYEAADLFVASSPELQHALVHALVRANVPNKIIKRRLTKFQLSDDAFPELVERRAHAAVRFHVYNHQYEDVLTMVRGDSQLALYACQFIVARMGAAHDIARLFVHRAGLGAAFPHVDTSEQHAQSFPNQDDLAPEASCLSLAALLGHDGRLVFVDTAPQLHACVAHLLASDVVGFDCEWKSVTTAAAGKASACAVLQLASAAHVFVVDMLAFPPTACAPLCAVFQHASLVKLGFDTKGDVQALRQVLPVTAHEQVVVNLVDVQALAKALWRHQRAHPKQKQDQTEAVVEDGEVVETNVHEPTDGDERGQRDDIGDNAAHQAQQQQGEGASCRVSGINTDTVAPSPSPSPPSTPSGETLDRRRREDGPHRSDRRSKRAKKHNGGNGGAETMSLSLSAVTEHYLGKPLDKRSRMSDWERRPLTAAQLHYAALDAFVLVAIYAQMKERVSTAVFERLVASITKAPPSRRKQLPSASPKAAAAASASTSVPSSPAAPSQADAVAKARPTSAER